jgi:curved DNA-binding protein CbpA
MLGGVTAVFVDYYEVLEVDPLADAAAIKAAYRSRMLRDHVDQNPDDPQAKERTILLAQAKQVLLDDQRRRAFDQQRSWWLATRRFQVPPPGNGATVEVDLRDVSLGKLIVGAGVAVLLGGLFVAAKAVADRQSRQSRRRR